MKNYGLYIHIPFCKSKCFYCDFTSFVGKDSLMEDYVDALIKEIKLSATSKTFDSVYFGGGTPSALPDYLIERLLDVIFSFDIKKDAEITFEMNPESVTKEKAELLKKKGINRISIGLQSSQNHILKKIGRVHDFNTFKSAYQILREVGFNNINIDVMYGLPLQTTEELSETLDIVTKLKPEHLSVYSLILEEGTIIEDMIEKGRVSLPKEDELLSMMKLVKDKLNQNNYIRYEISNYALEGLESKHNFKYWNFSEYVAVGVSASGFEDGIRYTNTSDINEYIQKINNNISPKEVVHKNSKEENIEEFIFMGLRTNRGVNLDSYQNIFNEKITDRFKDVIEKYRSLNLIKMDDHTLVLTPEAFDVSNYIMSDFILNKE